MFTHCSYCKAEVCHGHSFEEPIISSQSSKWVKINMNYSMYYRFKDVLWKSLWVVMVPWGVWMSRVLQDRSFTNTQLVHYSYHNSRNHSSPATSRNQYNRVMYTNKRGTGSLSPCFIMCGHQFSVDFQADRFPPPPPSFLHLCVFYMAICFNGMTHERWFDKAATYT